jgi:hypothetical protein
MQLNPRALVLQFGHVAQQHLFPMLEEAIGTLSPQLELLAAVASLVPLGRLLAAARARTGRPAKDRAALATAFIAKAIFNVPTTRDLIGRLRVDQSLRQLCGWKSVAAIPHESKFSRAFAEFATAQLPQQLHQDVVRSTQGERLIGHIARDSTAIPARERVAEALMAEKRAVREQKQKQKEERHAKRGRPKGSTAKKQTKKTARASERGTRIQRQPHQKLEVMLADLPQQCDIGLKSKEGYDECWRGYKLHLDVADGQVPISALLTSASVHDSQVAIPLMTLSSQRVAYLYELMDSAYDADDIRVHSCKLNHVPIIAPHPRRGTKQASQLPKVFPVTLAPEMPPAQQDRFKERTMIERVNGRLKDEFGASHLRVRGAAKVMAHLMFGVLVLTVDQWLRMGKAG